MLSILIFILAFTLLHFSAIGTIFVILGVIAFFKRKNLSRYKGDLLDLFKFVLIMLVISLVTGFSGLYLLW